MAATVTGWGHLRATHCGVPWSLFQQVSGEPSKRCCLPRVRVLRPSTELTRHSHSPTNDTSVITLRAEEGGCGTKTLMEKVVQVNVREERYASSTPYTHSDWGLISSDRWWQDLLIVAVCHRLTSYKTGYFTLYSQLYNFHCKYGPKFLLLHVKCVRKTFN